ncbi:glycosyltransferase [uncultured Cedecea sp.]|uniref:glycosyltransferase family 8 protein n=1 Tax=uncultured Cedecea sp. TaxID=988762 RepID=UPI0026399EC0|nr:glycosyltransferase [uncultured Cedecea sp.]
MNFDCRQAIKEKIEFHAAPEGSTPTFNIAWGVDKNFMFGAAISMTSVLLKNKDLAIHFHLFTDYIDEDYLARVKALAQQHQTTITLYLMNAEELKALPSGIAWSYATYFRFIAFEYLSDEINNLLYIDADVICKGSLTELSRLSLEGHVAAVIRDVVESRTGAARRLNNEAFSDDYFNAGVIYANLQEWKARRCLETAFEMLMNKNNHFAFLDQDVLNIIFQGKVIFLSRHYDEIYGMKQELKSKDITAYKKFITHETILIHYVGVTKPWHSWANYPSAEDFKLAWRASPWRDVPLLGAKTPKQFKKKSRHERLQGKFFTSVISYIGYLKAKLQSK